MKQWLRRKLLNILNDESTEACMVNGLSRKSMTGTAMAGSRTSNGELQFTVSAARGGLIVNVRTYDKQRDDYVYLNHLIHDDQDANNNIADIVSLELMKL